MPERAEVSQAAENMWVALRPDGPKRRLTNTAASQIMIVRALVLITLKVKPSQLNEWSRSSVFRDATTLVRLCWELASRQQDIPGQADFQKPPVSRSGS
jgi:hypothetical protein